MPQTMPRGMDELETYTNPTFQPFGLEDGGYLNSDSSSTSSKKSLSFHAEAEFSDTAFMPVMVTEATNFEEQRASLEATLDRLSKRVQKRTLKSSLRTSILLS